MRVPVHMSMRLYTCASAFSVRIIFIYASVILLTDIRACLAVDVVLCSWGNLLKSTCLYSILTTKYIKETYFYLSSFTSLFPFVTFEPHTHN